MAIKVAINGFGRIGRLCMRASLLRKDIERLVEMPPDARALALLELEGDADSERLLPRQSPGRYTLDIIAAGADGRWSEPITLAVEVMPPWWRAWWAWALYALVGLAVLGAAALVYRRRVQAQAEERGLQDARRVAQQASEAKTAFLADLGHELRTPLTGVLGMTELMLKDPLPEPQRQRAETVMRAGQHLLRLVNDTLDLARIEAGRLLLQDEAFDLAALATDVGQLLRPNAQAKGLDFAVQLAPGLPPRVRGDESRLRQILLNLGGNAIKFTERGRVTLALRPLPGGGVQFDVEDTGIDGAVLLRRLADDAEAGGLLDEAPPPGQRGTHRGAVRFVGAEQDSHGA
jgi:signal transduction histidine kinase